MGEVYSVFKHHYVKVSEAVDVKIQAFLKQSIDGVGDQVHDPGTEPPAPVTWEAG
jgi:hypothetical protein